MSNDLELSLVPGQVKPMLRGGAFFLLASLAAPMAWAEEAPPAEVPDAAVPAAPTALVTAPSLKLHPVLSAPPIAGGVREVSATGALAPAAPTVDEGVPTVLPSNLHVWPLRFREAPQLGALLIDVPDVSEARLMLPGRASDAVAAARYNANKYISDAVGLAAQGRARQLDAWEAWLAQTEIQARKLDSADPWQLYQFRLEARREVAAYRRQIEGQATQALERMATDVRRVISKIAAVMNLMPTYEIKTGWYAVLVQIKDGVTLYQSQVLTTDRHMLRRLDDYLTANPVISRPSGTPPDRSLAAAGKPAVSAAPVAAPSISVTPPREPSRPAPAAEPASTGPGIIVVIGLVVFGFAGLFLKLRRRGASAKIKTE